MTLYTFTGPISSILSSKFYPIKHGWGNGYVAIPKEHPLYGKDYMHPDVNLDAHGGITFSDFANSLDLNELPELQVITDDIKDYWVFGFDTLHAGDDEENCNEEYVKLQTLLLKLQLEQLTQTN